MAAVCGIVWGVVMGLVPFFYLNFLLAPGIGYAIGEVISLSVNRKRGTSLAVVAGIAVAISFLISFLSPWGLSFFPANILRLVLNLVALALGIFIAVTRLRK